MKNRLLIVALAFVVLPTAILALLAGHSLRAWELLLEQRLLASAEGAVDGVVDDVERSLLACMANVEQQLGHAVKEVGRYHEVQAAAERLRDKEDLVQHVYIFMNPWGFVYPERMEEGLDDDAATVVGNGPDDENVHLDSVVETLRRTVATHRVSGGLIPCRANGRMYCFSELDAPRALYAGFELDPQGVRRVLDQTLDDASIGGLIMSLASSVSESQISAAGESGIVVSDSLAPRELSSRRPAQRRGEWNGVLLRRRLPAPLDSMTVYARLVDPAKWVRAGVAQRRLYTWGVIVLSVGILLGVWLVFAEAGREVRRAREKSEFLIGVSHDLRTPIASVRILAESLSLGHVAEEEKRQRFLNSILANSERLQQLVERVLFLFKFGQGAIRYDFVETAPLEFVKSVIGAFPFRALADKDVADREAGVAVRCADERELPHVDVDAAALEQVLFNLFDNAEKYDDSGLLPQVAVSATKHRRPLSLRTREWVRIDVQDHGIGMNGRESKQIFRRFYRSPGARDRNVSGVGLGLSLCAQVVAAHGGFMTVESEQGKGSTFSVFLPAKRESLAEAQRPQREGVV